MRTGLHALHALAPVLGAALVLGACSHAGKPYDVQAINQDAGAVHNAPVKEVTKAEVSQSLTRIADSLRETGDYQTAIGVYQRARAADPKDPAISLGLAKTLWAVGDWEGAGQAYEATHTLDPTNREARIGIGNALVLTGRLDEAVKQFQGLIVDMPDEPKVYSGLGIAYDLQGKHRDAQLRYGMGLEIAPNNVATKNNLALSFALAHDYATAIELLRALPDNPSTRQTLALVYGLANQPDEAAKLARADLDETAVQNNLDYYAWLRSLDGKAQAEAVLLGRTPTSDAVKTASSDPEPTVEAAPPAVPVQPVKQAKVEPPRDVKPKPMNIVPAEKVSTPTPVVHELAEQDGAEVAASEVAPVEPPVEPVTVTAQKATPVRIVAGADQPAIVTVPSTKKSQTLYQAQLASFRSYDDTEGVREELVRKHSDLLNGVDLVIEEADLGPEKGAYHRLRTAPSADKTGTQALCRALKAAGAACYVVKAMNADATPSGPKG